MAFVHGSKGRVTVNGVPLKMTKVSRKYKKPAVQTTNSETTPLANGAIPEEYLDGGGIHGLEGSVEAYYDIESTPYGPPPNLAGVAHVPMEIYDVKGGKKTVIPKAHIEEIEVNQEVTANDAVKYSFSWKASGSFTMPL